MKSEATSTLRQCGAVGCESRVAGQGGEHQGSADGWRIVRTGARREKIFARQCRAAGITCFLPLTRVARPYGNVTCRVEVPLFTGYLFAQADEARLRAADASGSIRDVTAAHQPAIGWQISSLATALDRDIALDPSPRLDNGKRVRVRSGALAGVQGLVDTSDAAGAPASAGVGLRRLVLQLDALGQAFSTLIDAAALAPLDA